LENTKLKQNKFSVCLSCCPYRVLFSLEFVVSEILSGLDSLRNMIQLHGLTSASETPHASEKDAALAVVSEVAQEIDPVVEKRVRRKIDSYLMPAMLIGALSFYEHFY
jgi:hypothetical protein